MKKLSILFTLCILLFASISFAEPAKFLFQNASSITDSVNLSTGTGMEAKDARVICSYTESGGTVTALVIDVLGTIGEFDGTEYDVDFTHTFTATDLSNNRASMIVTDNYASGWKANITTLTKTGSASVTCKIARHRAGKN